MDAFLFAKHMSAIFTLLNGSSILSCYYCQMIYRFNLITKVSTHFIANIYKKSDTGMARNCKLFFFLSRFSTTIEYYDINLLTLILHIVILHARKKRLV